MKRIFAGLLTMSALALLTPAAAVAQDAAKPALNNLNCSVIGPLMDRYLSTHVAHATKSKELEERFVTLYADSFDPSKIRLTVGEHDALKKRVRAAIKDVRAGKCDALVAIQKDHVKWAEELEAFVAKTVADKKLKIDKTVELQMNSDKRERPKTVAERDALRLKVIHFQLANYVLDDEKMKEAKKKLAHRYTLITKRTKDITEHDLHSDFLNVYANALDPHSTYFSPEALEDFRISMDLSLEGIGAVLTSRDGYTIVNEIVPGGAAARQGGLKVKDKIIAVTQGTKGDAVDVIDQDLSDVVRLIRGKRGTKVKLTVLRQGKRTERLEFLIVRDKIDLKQQAAKLRWEKVERDGKTLNLAILDLPSFYGGSRESGGRDCVKDVRDLLKEVNDKGADGLVLDLSRNGGGLLSAAVDISGLFLGRGGVVGVDSPNSPPQVLDDRDPRIQYAGPMVVLISRLSASASEILAGALQDYKRAVIVGDDHTFGKGTVQNIVGLPPGFGALKVTTALFFRPGGQSTQNLGVRSDIEIPSPFSGEEIGEKHLPYALPSSRIDAFPSKDINAAAKGEGFDPVDPRKVSELTLKSEVRVSKNEEFKELDEARAKRQKNSGIIKVQDMFDEKGKKGKKDDEEEDKDKLTPQAVEALEIMADYVMILG